MAQDEDFLSDCMEEFDECVDHEHDNRADALDDLRFARLSEQWPEKVRKQRETDGRPCLTINKLPASIRQVVNDARQNSPSITVHPMDSKADPKTAEVISGLIRNIEEQSNADIAYDTALDFAVTMGFGYWRVNTEYATEDTFDLDIRIKQVPNPFSVYGDPYNDGPDSADWNLAYVVDSISKRAFEKKYRDAETVDWKAEPYNGLKAPWIDGERIQIAERWHREEVPKTILLLSDGLIVPEDEFKANKDTFTARGLTVAGNRSVRGHLVTQVIMSGAEVLERRKWAGKYIPIIPVYGEDLNVEGKRHLRSMIRDAKDPQRMVNYWRTIATELVALAPKAPYIGPKGAFETDAVKWQSSNTNNYPYIEYDGQVAPSRQPFSGIPAGALQEALNASDDMKAIMGMFDASLGAQGNETSGRAILARQKEGDVGSFHFVDNLSRSVRHGGRVVLDLIPKIYDEPRIVRVLGIDGKAQAVPINQPVILRKDQPPQPVPQPAPGAPPVLMPGQPMPQQQQPAPQGQPMDPETAEAIEHVFDLTSGKYDLTVDAGPSYTTQRQEAASQMMELLRAFPQAAPVIGDLLASNLDWPGADEIAKRIKAYMDSMNPQPQQGGPDPAMMAQLQKLTVMVQGLQQQNQALQQDRSLDAQKNRIDAYEAETHRLKVAADASKPSHLPGQTL